MIYLISLHTKEESKAIKLKHKLSNGIFTRDYELYQDFLEFTSEESLKELCQMYNKARIVEDLDSEF